MNLFGFTTAYNFLTRNSFPNKWIIVVIALSLASSLFAESMWAKSYQFGGERTFISDIDKSSDGNYLVFGSIPEPNYSIFVLKITPTGEIIWEKIYENAGECNSGITTADGGYIIVGSSYTKEQDYDQVIIKVDSQGNEEWNKTITSNENLASSEDVIFSVVQSDNGSYTFSGITNYYVNILKTDSLGNVLWNNTFGDGLAFTLTAANDGGVIAVGTSSKLLWYWKVKPNGEEEFQTGISGGGDDAGIGKSLILHSISNTDDGGYITTGLAFPDTSNQYNKHDVILAKLDSNGMETWQIKLGKSWASHDTGFDVVQTNDGGYAITGYTQNDNNSDKNLWLLKTDSAGTIEWDTTTSLAEIGNDILIAYDGGYIISNASGIIIKTDSEGHMPDTVVEAGYYVPTSSEQSSEQSSMSSPMVPSSNKEKDLGQFPSSDEVIDDGPLTSSSGSSSYSESLSMNSISPIVHLATAISRNNLILIHPSQKLDWQNSIKHLEVYTLSGERLEYLPKARTSIYVLKVVK